MKTLEMIGRIIIITLLVAGFAALGLWQAGATRADPRCPATASRCLYVAPAEVQAARIACYRNERQARGIPGDRDAYLTWWEANQRTQVQAEWIRAHRACTYRYTQEGGFWAWSGLVYVGSH
jgi:hypothetical protein